MGARRHPPRSRRGAAAAGRHTVRRGDPHPLLRRGHRRVPAGARRAGRRHPAAGQARRGSHRRTHRTVRADRDRRHVGGRAADRWTRRAAGADDATDGGSRGRPGGCARGASVSPSATWLLFAAIVLFGATIGNILMLQPLVIAERFGVRDYPRIFSRTQLVAVVGTAGGPLLLGSLYDVFGSYRVPYAWRRVFARRCARALARRPGHGARRSRPIGGAVSAARPAGQRSTAMS